MISAAHPPDALHFATSRRAPSLRKGEIHVWSIKLQDAAGLLSDHAVLLSQEELRRADSFRFEIDRCRFMAARGTLRRILAAYTGATPQSVQIATTESGKPFLAKPPTPLHFNLAHSADRALIALAAEANLGIDLEDLRHESRVADLAESICSKAERCRLETLLPPLRNRALLRLWTAKEAFLKSTGLGLQVDPVRLEVSHHVSTGSREPSSIHWLDQPARSRQYCLYPLPECEARIGASAALATTRTGHLHRIVWIDAATDRRPTWVDEE